MIDTQTEEVLSLTAASKLLPTRRGGKRPHVSCLYRWSQAGCKGVVLETIQIGGTRCTSREALERFFNQLTFGKSAETLRSVPQRERAIERAERELARDGI